MEKRKEHKISSGCVILNGYVEVTLTKDHANSTLSQIEAKVEEAQMQRTGKQLMLERFARIWTPLVLLTVSWLISQTWKSATRFFPHSPFPMDPHGSPWHLPQWQPGATCLHGGTLGQWPRFPQMDPPRFGVWASMFSHLPIEIRQNWGSLLGIFGNIHPRYTIVEYH